MREEGTELLRVLEKFGALSGQQVNLDKSNVVFSKNTPVAIREAIANLLGIKHSAKLGRYLGLDIDLGMRKRDVFENISSRLEKRIHGWAEQYLSQSGKEVLLKLVGLALPIYTMNCFKLPVGVCKEINGKLACYWWQKKKEKRGIHWGAWDDLTKPKNSSGMNFRDIHCFNLALLGKQG